MQVKHFPVTKADLYAALYAAKEGVGVRYVCTTELKGYGTIYDIFYRGTPHPQFGNRYFGLGYYNKIMYITNGDNVENLEFACISNGRDEWTYSQGTHDYRHWGSGAIDGGRSYHRIMGNSIPTIKYFEVKDGEFRCVS